MKRGCFAAFVVLVLFLSLVSAQNENNQSGVELEIGPGITPDSAFYFLEDYILSKFRDDLENREKKIAEIKAMVEAGNIEAARKALNRYKRYAKILEREIAPEHQEEAERSAAAIRAVIAELEDLIPEEDRDEFIDGILEQEDAILTAAQIAARIKALCEDLAELDPIQYERTCRTNDDSPEWHKRLDKDLTEEQREEAKEFFEIM